MSTDPNSFATMRDLAEAFNAATATTGGVALYQSLAIIGALAEARLLDPRAVAKWASFFAESLPPTTPPEAHESVRAGIEGFALALRALAELPPGAGRA
jgi:hypothetical protein